MNKPTISIITATYNSAETVRATIESVNHQTYKQFEHIIVDGLSTDNTIEIVKKTAQHPVKIIQEKDDGIYDALNKGIRNATGDAVGFLHSDDEYFDNNSLEKIAAGFSQENSDAVYGDLIYISKDSNKTVRNWQAGNYNSRKLRLGWMPPHPTFYMKNDLYKKLGSFDTQFRIAADYDSMLRYLYQHKINAHYIHSTLVKMKTGGESNRSLKNLTQKTHEDIQVLKKNNINFLPAIAWKNLSKISQFLN